MSYIIKVVIGQETSYIKEIDKVSKIFKMTDNKDSAGHFPTKDDANKILDLIVGDEELVMSLAECMTKDMEEIDDDIILDVLIEEVFLN